MPTSASASTDRPTEAPPSPRSAAPSSTARRSSRSSLRRTAGSSSRPRIRACTGRPNFGDTWALALAPGDTNTFGNFVSDVISLDGDGTRLLAAIGWRGGAPSNGLYLSNNRGQSWTALGSPRGFAPQARLGRMTLAQAPSAPDRLFAIVQDARYFNLGGPNGTVLNGVYRSENGPTGPWTPVVRSPELEADPGSAMDRRKIGVGFGPGVQAWYNQHIEVDPTDADHVMLGLEEIYQSTDGGEAVGHRGSVLELLLRETTVAPVTVVQRGPGDRGEHAHHAPGPARRRLHVDRRLLRRERRRHVLPRGTDLRQRQLGEPEPHDLDHPVLLRGHLRGRHDALRNAGQRHRQVHGRGRMARRDRR